jgi:thiol-disulfide isomerase/thioredoxin
VIAPLLVKQVCCGRSLQMRYLALVFALALAACRPSASPSLAIGSAAPAFALPGADGATHSIEDYAASPVLAVVFTCNHCPAAQLYEARLQRLYEDYRGRGVALVAINPDHPSAVPARDLAFTDVGDSLAEMKTRAAYRHLEYPYLFDGDDQRTAKAFRIAATPQIFVFDRERTLRYEGRIDDNLQESKVTQHDARDAIDALLAGKPVTTTQTRAAGCVPVWRNAAPDAAASVAPVKIEMGTPDVLKALRANGTGKLLLVNFWATWCGPCAVEFPDLVATSEMYRRRPFEFVSVSENQPEERDLVLAFLNRHRAANRNVLFASPQTYDLQAAFDPAMPAAVPFTLVIASNGDVVYQELGSLDILKLRRAILANLPDDREHPGMQAHWAG